MNFSKLTKRLKEMNFAESIESIKQNGPQFRETPEFITNNYGKFKLAGEKLSDEATKLMFHWSTKRAQENSIDSKMGKYFTANFYECLKLHLTKKQLMLKFPKDFNSLISKMKPLIEKNAADKKVYEANHKLEIAKEKADNKEKYGYAYFNGEKKELMTYQVEAEGIFYSHSDKKTHGGWTPSAEPEDITINASEAPKCPKGHHWGKVIFTNAYWTASYHKKVYVGENCVSSAKIKYVKVTNAENPTKQEHDNHKFDIVPLIDKNWPKITRAIKKMALSSKYIEKQIGCCAYLVSQFSIRAGNDSDRDNGVVGATQLLVKNVDLSKKNYIHLNFLGKSSMAYDEIKKVEPEIYNSFLELQEDLEDIDRIFADINSNKVNRFLGSICKDIPELTMKNIRTFYGTSLLAKAVQSREDQWSDEMTNSEFKALYNECAKEVAIKLNHKKTVKKDVADKKNAANELKLSKAKAKYKEDLKKAKLKLGKTGDEELYNELVELAKERLDDVKRAITDEESNREIALGTSKGNYSDPKIPISLAKYCKKDPSLLITKATIALASSRFDLDELDEEYWLNYPNV